MNKYKSAANDIMYKVANIGKNPSVTTSFIVFYSIL